MDILRPIIDFAISATCIFFSLFLIAAQRFLKINDIFYRLGWYLFFISNVSLVHAFVHLPMMVQYSRELLTIQRILGICAGFPLVLLVRKINKNTLKKIQIRIIFAVLAVLFTIAFLDLVFEFNWLFYDPPPRINAAPFYKMVYIPFSIFGMSAMGFMLFRAYRSLSGGTKKLIGIVVFGFFIQLPFAFWDFISVIVKKDPFGSTIYLYNPGIIIFFILIFIFIIKFIKMHMKYPSMSSFADTKEKYKTAGRGDQALFGKIEKMMKDDKAYYDPDITIEKLARITGETRNNLSRIINLFFKDNFKAYVNSHRVEEMKAFLSETNLNMSILEVGFLVGFNSKTSINRAFHHFVKMTPMQYRRFVLGESSGEHMVLFQKKTTSYGGGPTA